MKKIILIVALFAASCTSLSVKQQIDRADRTAFASLRAFQQTESAAYHAKLPWPTDQQHKDIGAALSKAYDLVIDVAQAGVALKPGDPIPAQLHAEVDTLTKLVDDVLTLSASAPPNIQAAAKKAQTDSAALVTTVTGGK